MNSHNFRVQALCLNVVAYLGFRLGGIYIKTYFIDLRALRKIIPIGYYK